MYTSRLPVSIRRPTSQVSSTSRPSHIPQTVRKANLFTPQTKHRSFSIEQSTAGKSSMSGMNTERKFQRATKPPPDKDEQMRMFQTLVDFIKKNVPAMTPPEAKKFFSSVSTTESLRIFQVLISFLLPDFKIVRLETEVPEALTILRYPYIRSVTRSSLVSVTTRQAAVGLLVIFNWLINYITTSVDIFNEEDPSITTQISRIVVTQPQRLEEATKELFDKLLQMPDLEAERLELEAVCSEAAELNIKKEEKESLENLYKTYEEDISRSHDYKKELEKYRQQNIDKLDERDQSRSKLKIRLEVLKERHHKARLQITNHQYTIEKVTKDQDELKVLKSENEKLQVKIDELNIKKQGIEQSKNRSSEAFKNMKSTYLTHIKSSIEIYETYFEFDTQNMEKRRTILSEWALKLDQLDENDHTAQTQKFFTDLNSVLQELRCQDPMVESELSEGISIYKQKLYYLKTSVQDAPGILEKLDEELRRIEDEGRNEELKLKDLITKLTQKNEKDQNELEDLKMKLESIIFTLNHEKDIVFKQLQVAKANASDTRETNTKLLNETCIRMKKEQANLLKIAEEDFARWEEFHRIISQNAKVVKTKFVKLKRKISKK